ncbi:MAG: pseudouridine synthase [Myxococcota bacterium]
MSKDTRWRLDKLLSHVLPTTRSSAQRLVRAGRVRIDETPAEDPATHVEPARQTVYVDDAPIAPPGPIILVMHKPAGVVSSTDDARDQTVIDLVPHALRRRTLAPVGRLDKDTTGLLLLTDDGPFAHVMTHPRRHVPKVYQVSYSGELTPDAVERVAAGLSLGDESCLPAELALTGPGAARLVLHEGKHHQVKRMISVLGGLVTALHRTRIGGLELPPDLAPGDVRLITEAELAQLR